MSELCLYGKVNKNIELALPNMPNPINGSNHFINILAPKLHSHQIANLRDSELPLLLQNMIANKDNPSFGYSATLIDMLLLDYLGEQHICLGANFSLQPLLVITSTDKSLAFRSLNSLLYHLYKITTCLSASKPRDSNDRK